MKINFIILCLLIFIFKVDAQLNIKGQTVTNTGDSLPFSNISISNTSIGTSSNGEGNFYLKFSETNLNDSLVITQLGYRTFKKSLRKIVDEKIDIFELRPSPMVLNEVILESINPKNIALQAFSKLNVNHQERSYETFFRGYTAKNGDWKQFVEAALYVKKLGLYFGENTNPEVYLNEIRKSVNLFKEKNTKTTLNGNLKYLLLFNPEKYNYKLEDIIENDKSLIYKISFGSKKGRFKGDLLIDKKTYGFHNIHYQATELSNRKLRKSTNLIDGKKIKTYINYRIWDVEITFTRANGDFFFKSIKHKVSRNIFDRSNKHHSLFKSDFIGEMYFANIKEDLTNLKIIPPGKNVFNIQKPHNKNFWDNYNFVIRDSLQRSVLKLLEE